MHLISPPRPQILHNLCFLTLLGITAVPREIENNAYAKLDFLGKILFDYLGNAFEQKKKERRVKFNPGLVLIIGLRTTGPWVLQLSQEKL